MSFQQQAIKSLLSAYKWTRSTGLLDNPFMERVFIWSYFLYKRYLEDSLASLLRRNPGLIGEGDILDIGANIGYTAVLFSKFLRAGSLVHAFEPDLGNFKSLGNNIRSYKLAEKVIPHQMAVGASPGFVELWINEDHRADHRIVTDKFRGAIKQESRTIKVPLISIDSFLEKDNKPRNVSFIKIDVQGYELGVCEGMQKTLLANPRAPVLFEHCPYSSKELGFEVDAVPKFFWERGYRLFRIASNGELSEFTEAELESDGVKNQSEHNYFDLLALKR